MALTETRIKALKSKDRPFKLADQDGLYMLVTATGARYWRWNYSHAGKQKTLALGVWPDVKLLDARSRCQEARDQLRQGQDPGVMRKAAKLAGKPSGTTFGDVGGEVVAKLEAEHRSDKTIARAKRMRALAAPVLGPRDVKDIAIPDVLGLLKSIEAKGQHETASRLRVFISTVFLHAIVTGRATVNPATDLHLVLVSPQATPRPAILDPVKVGALMLGVWEYDGRQPVVGLALRFLAMTFVRPGELRFAQWPEFDLDSATWCIPAERTKMRREHLVPLSTQALEALRTLKATHGDMGYVFPSVTHRGRPISDGTLSAALRRLGYTSDEMVPHGFRSIASTHLNESGLFRPDVIERQLAHIDSNSVRRAYNRAEFWPERVKLMQWWGDHLDALRTADPLYLPSETAAAANTVPGPH